jgi:class 3 adenylate cyclase
MDIVDFTAISSRMSARDVVRMLVKVFGVVEKCVAKFPRVEKVKTIGDAFMCSSGLMQSEALTENLTEMGNLALALTKKNYDIKYEDELGRTHDVAINFRFGVHCGEAVAGIISKTRFAFDVLGDTVNVAARMESMSQAGRVLVSDAFRRAVEPAGCFAFRDNGLRHVKGKGPMQTWFLEEATVPEESGLSSEPS